MQNMKKLTTLFFASVLVFGVASITRAQMMNGGMMASGTNTAATSEETEGKALWDKLRVGQITCNNLADKDFDLLGEYFMGTMMGASHEAMNDRLKQALGDAGESQMHVVLGKRMSGCDTSAAYPAGFSGFMPMMGERSSPNGLNSTNNMMNSGYGFGFFGWTFMFLLWALTIALLVATVKWIANQSRGGSSKSALDILKERYAKGEIDKKEFEEKKKELQ